MTDKRQRILERIDAEIQREHGSLDFWRRNITEKIARLEKDKRMLYLLPSEVIDLDWKVGDSYVSPEVDCCLSLQGGDEEYAILFDAGFEFPPKPEFCEGNQTFFRKGLLKVYDPTQEKLVVIQARVGNIEKPPSCTVIEKKKRKTVTVFEAVCNETGEAL